MNQEVREKVANSFYKNDSIKTSRPQIYIYNLYKSIGQIELNYPIKYYIGDIVDLDNKIDIEINFGGHYIPLYSGKETEEEFQEREMRRGCCIVDNGYKIMRIISRYDYIPSDEVLLSIYHLAIKLYNEGWNWVDFDIDKNMYIYAEYKEGINYDFGNLRKIKKGESTDNINLISVKRKEKKE